MTTNEIALCLGVLGVLAPHLSAWAVIAFLLWMLINSNRDGDAA
jgi:hypothetical protein